jgi:hypothetical protein
MQVLRTSGIPDLLEIGTVRARLIFSICVGAALNDLHENNDGKSLYRRRFINTRFERLKRRLEQKRQKPCASELLVHADPG